MFFYSQFLDSWKSFLLGATALTFTYGVYKFLNLLLIAPLLSTLRDLPGPENPSIIFGNLQDVFKGDPGELHKKWVELYGSTLTYRGFFNHRRLMTLDPKGLSHALNHSYDWQKPEEIRTNLAQLLGEGVLFAEGDVHKRQRRIMNPSFSLSYIRELTVVFHDKSQELRDMWLKHAAENGGTYNTDVLSWLNKVALDIIGLAGFNYEFNSLNSDEKDNELISAWKIIIKQSQNFSILNFLQVFVPPLRIIPTPQRRNIKSAAKVMDRIGRTIVSNGKKAILAMAGDQGKSASGETHIEKRSIATRDVLSRLMAANMATDLSENQRLSDADVLGQIPTFLVAGNDTTSVATTWCLYALCRDLTVQNKLRDELLTVGTDTPIMDELNSLSYLDGVVRETLRLYPPVSSTIRVATKDDVVPLGTPFTDRKGRLQHEIRVRKGDTMFIPIITVNTAKSIWGEDAEEFRPERWRHIPEKAAELPGVYNGIMTFLGGPRSCIGYRFALIEFKCLLFALVRTFNFEMQDPSMVIGKKSNIVTRPIVKSELEKGPRMPLKITPLRGM